MPHLRSFPAVPLVILAVILAAGVVLLVMQICGCEVHGLGWVHPDAD